MTAREARKVVINFMKEKGIPYSKVIARTLSFGVSVEVLGVSMEHRNTLLAFARTQPFSIVPYVELEGGGQVSF